MIDSTTCQLLLCRTELALRLASSPRINSIFDLQNQPPTGINETIVTTPIFSVTVADGMQVWFRVKVSAIGHRR